MTVLTEPETDPHADNGDPTHSNLPPNTGVPATHRVSSDGATHRTKCNKQTRLRDFLQKTIFYSQNIHGSGKRKDTNTGTIKFDYITDLMHEKGIDVYLVQETWLSSDYEDRSVINGCYVFHHGTNEEASDSNDDGDEENPQNQNRKG